MPGVDRDTAAVMMYLRCSSLAPVLPAMAGKTVDEIVRFYYRGVRVKQAW